VKRALLEQLLLVGRTGAAALATDLASGAQSLVTAGATEGDLALGPEDLAQVRKALDEDQSRTIETATGRVFVEVWNPRLRLIVVGAVHIAQALIPLARLTGYDVTLIDPRTAFGTPARFPDTALTNDWPNEALPALKPDRRTAILTLTHDPKIDDPALEARCGRMPST